MLDFLEASNVRPCWEQNIKFEQNPTTFYYIQKYEASTKKGKGLLECIIVAEQWTTKICEKKDAPLT